MNYDSLLRLGYSKSDDFYYYRNNTEFFTTILVKNETVVLIDHNICSKKYENIFNYEVYTQMQNELMNKYSKCLRIYYSPETFESDIEELFDDNDTIEFTREHYLDRNISTFDNTPVESEFEARFQEVFGLDALQFVHKEYGLIDKYQNQYFYDFVVETSDLFIAVEENGVRYHHPQIIGEDTYRKQLQKQNTFVKSQGKLYRWSSMDCLNIQRVNEDVRTFFGDRSSFLSKGLIVGQRKVGLYSHQEDTLKKIYESRKNGNSAFLVVFPTAAGKSKIIEEDLQVLLNQNPALKICIASPTSAITEDWKSRILNITKEMGLPITISGSIYSQITIGTYHVLYSNINKIPKDFFDYIVIDEAHHSVAPMLKRALIYFTPKYLLGLSATPFRSDSEKIEEIFGSYQVQLTIEDAMAKNIIVPARAYRLITNVNLEDVRFNGKQFINADLERTIRVNSRNELIAQVIEQYFNQGEAREIQGIIFCVNIKHTEEIASILNHHGIPAAALNSSRDVGKYYENYRNKKIRFLCSCGMINEGWDSPQTSMVIMARPTLSKTLYIQQLGRGFRKYPGKKFLYVIDIVDQYGSLAIPWTLNSIFSNPYYVPFGDVTKRYNVGEMITVYGISEKIQKVEEIQIDTFESKYGEYLSVEQAARELYIGTGSLSNWIRNGTVKFDLEIPFGVRKLQYFTKESVEKIRVDKSLGIHNSDTIHSDFLEFIEQNQYTFSFKIVFMLAFLKTVDQNGEASLDEIRQLYVSFYLERLNKNIQVDRQGCVYTKEYLENESLLNNSILTNPFEKFERKRFIFYSKNLNKISFNTSLWDGLLKDDLRTIETTLIKNLGDYYSQLDGLQEIVYLRRYT